jgi:hypothetical protein
VEGAVPHLGIAFAYDQRLTEPHIQHNTNALLVLLSLSLSVSNLFWPKGSEFEVFERSLLVS